MSTLDDRKQGFENKFKHDEELQFKAEARRNKLLGLWAAGLMGLNEAESLAYAAEVIQSDFEEPGDEDVFRKVFGDLQAKQIDKSEHQVRRQMDELMAEAKNQIMNEI